ncbi:MAG: nickel-responsive transcriptional regulator NikR [Candidatus Micrarchaeota archaeon]
MSVTRIAISLEPEVVEKLEERMKNGIYLNRSKAISDILRDSFLREEVAKGKGMRVGTISLAYNHHLPGIQDKITEVQHNFGLNVIASLHIHLSHEECLEVIAVKGNSDKLQKITDSIAAIRGVNSCKLLIVK